MWVAVCYLLVTNCMSHILDISSGIKVLTQPQKAAMSHVVEHIQNWYGTSGQVERTHQIVLYEHWNQQSL